MDIKFIDSSIASISKTYKTTEITTKKTAVEKEETAPRSDSLVLSPEAKAMLDLSRAAVAEASSDVCSSDLPGKGSSSDAGRAER